MRLAAGVGSPVVDSLEFVFVVQLPMDVVGQRQIIEPVNGKRQIVARWIEALVGSKMLTE